MVNIRAYIESGILEMYVSDGLPEAEADKVARMVRKYPELQKEVDEIEASLEAFAKIYRKEPSSGLLDAILNKLEKETPEAPVVSERATPKFSEINWRIIAGLVSLAFLISIIFNVFQFRSIQATEAQLVVITRQQAVLAEQIQRTNQQLDILRNPGNSVIDLAGLDPAPGFAARVYWNVQSQEVYLHSGNLALPDLQRQFQLWAIADGKPVDLGVFDLSEDVQQLKSIAGSVRVSAFAISLEPRGGSATPTEVYLMGEV